MSSDATALVKQKQPAGKPKSWTKAAIIWASVGLVVILSFLLFLFWVVGITHGREFDAASWTFYRFTFVRNPLTGSQLTGISHSSDFAVPPQIIALTSGGPLSPGPRRDLVEMYKGTSYCVGQAQVLLDYLSAFDQQNNYFWLVWTNDHPQAAPILWSAVRDCVHLSRYDRLPELFEAARSNSTPTDLKARLKQIMLDIAKDEADLQTALGNPEAKKRAEILSAAYLSEATSETTSEAASEAADKPIAEVEAINP